MGKYFRQAENSRKYYSSLYMSVKNKIKAVGGKFQEARIALSDVIMTELTEFANRFYVQKMVQR